MKKLIQNHVMRLFIGCVLITSCFQLNAQTTWSYQVGFDEIDFQNATTVLQSGNGTTQYCYDFLINNGSGPSGSFIYASGVDGVIDMCVDATVVQNCPSWPQVEGDYDTSSNGSFRSDYTAGVANSSDPAICSAPNCNAFVKFDFTFLNGLETSVSACQFTTRHTSSNGSSEGYEWTEVFLNGVPAGVEAGMQAYTNADYSDISGCPVSSMTGAAAPANELPNGVTMSEFLTGMASGSIAPGGLVMPGWWAVDDFNTDIFCAEESSSANNPAGGNGGPNDNQTIGGSPAAGAPDGDFGLSDATLINQVTYYFGLTDVSFDTDGDGCTEMNTIPSAGVTLFDLGFKAPCEFPEPVITLTPNCDVFNITVGPIDESLASGTGTVISYSTAPTTGPANTTTLVTGAEALPADGATGYYIQICDAADATCCSEFGPFIAPTGVVPTCGLFPANN